VRPPASRIRDPNTNATARLRGAGSRRPDRPAEKAGTRDAGVDAATAGPGGKVVGDGSGRLGAGASAVAGVRVAVGVSSETALPQPATTDMEATTSADATPRPRGIDGRRTRPSRKTGRDICICV
jgi:hypothetical protein